MQFVVLLFATLSPVFPVAVGTEWTYTLDALAVRGTLVQRIESASRVDGGYELRISSKATLGAEIVMGEERLLLKGNAIHRVSGAMGAFRPSLCIYSGAPGSDWSWAGSVGEALGASATGRLLSDATVRLPAGRYDANVSEVSLHLGSSYSVSRYWLAKGVGFVRVEHDIPGGTVIAELQKFQQK